MKSGLPILCLAMTSSCSTENGSSEESGDKSLDITTENQVMSLMHYKTPCDWPFPTHCLVEDSDGELLNYAPNIDNFRFEWGYKQVIEVKTTRTISAQYDGSSLKIELVNVNSREEFTEPFSVILRTIEHLDSLKEVFQCSEEVTQCAIITESLEVGKTVVATFEFNESKTLELSSASIVD